MTDYKAAGVDIEAGDEAVFRMRQYVQQTFNEHVLTDIGSFGGMFRFNYEHRAAQASADAGGPRARILQVDTYTMRQRFEAILQEMVETRDSLARIEYVAAPVKSKSAK